LYDLLPRIPETYGINLVADAYRHESAFGDFGHDYRPLPAGEEWPLYRALNRFAMPTSRWTKEGEFFHVRRHLWYHDRLAEIPEPVARRWEAQLRRRPLLTLQDAAALAVALRDAQLREF